MPNLRKNRRPLCSGFPDSRDGERSMKPAEPGRICHEHAEGRRIWAAPKSLPNEKNPNESRME